MMQSPLGRLSNQSSCKHAKLGFTVSNPDDFMVFAFLCICYK